MLSVKQGPGLDNEQACSLQLSCRITGCEEEYQTQNVVTDDGKQERLKAPTVQGRHSELLGFKGSRRSAEGRYLNPEYPLTLVFKAV